MTSKMRKLPTHINEKHYYPFFISTLFFFLQYMHLKKSYTHMKIWTITHFKNKLIKL